MATIASGRSVFDLIQIAGAGGSFWMDPAGRSTVDLIQIVAAAKAGGGVVTILGTSGRGTVDLMQISNAGRGHVVFAPTRDFFLQGR